MPAKKNQQEPYEPAHEQLKKYRTQLVGSVGAVQAPLGSILHWPAHLTRPIIPADVGTKLQMLIESNGWLDSYNVMARLLSTSERLDLKDTITVMRGSKNGECEFRAIWIHAQLHTKERADFLLQRIAEDKPIYALIDGNHRIAAMTKLVSQLSSIHFTTPINVVAHSCTAPVALCRAVSALLNDTHYMGRASSFIDTLCYLQHTITSINSCRGGKRVTSHRSLIEEMRAAGCNVAGASNGVEDPDPISPGLAATTPGHMRIYWQWLQTIHEDGVNFLSDLQAHDGKAVYVMLEEHDGKRPWKGTPGAFLPGLNCGKYTPSKADVFVNHDCDEIVSYVGDLAPEKVLLIIMRAWAQWVEQGGKCLTKQQWMALNPAEEEAAAAEARIKNDGFTTEDLLFIDQLEEALPGSTNWKQVCMAHVYSYMRYLAITGKRATLATSIDSWHSKFPKEEISTTGLSISGYDSIVAAAMTKKEEAAHEKLLHCAREEYKVLMTEKDRLDPSDTTLVAAASMKELALVAAYDAKGYKSSRLLTRACTLSDCTHTHAITHYHTHTYTNVLTSTGLCWVRTMALAAKTTTTGRGRMGVMVVATMMVLPPLTTMTPLTSWMVTSMLRRIVRVTRATMLRV